MTELTLQDLEAVRKIASDNLDFINKAMVDRSNQILPPGSDTNQRNIQKIFRDPEYMRLEQLQSESWKEFKRINMMIHELKETA